jgi:hypothetical protein
MRLLRERAQNEWTQHVEGPMTRANQGDPPDFSVDGPCSATRRSFLAMMAALIGSSASAQDDTEDRGKSTPRLESMRRLAKEVKVCEITDGKQGRRWRSDQSRSFATPTPPWEWSTGPCGAGASVVDLPRS